MNERIRELAEQAGMNIVDDKFSTYGKFAEKFAELIVRECAKAAGDFEYARLHDSLVEDHVLKHFGVSDER